MVDDIDGLVRVLRRETEHAMPGEPMSDELIWAGRDAADVLEELSTPAPGPDAREGLVEDDAEGLVNRLITACEDAHGVSNTEWTDDVDEAYDTLLRALRDRLREAGGE